MQKIAKNIFTTTGISLVFLAVIGSLYGARFLLISSVLQTLGANVVIHLGLMLTRRFESKYFLLEAALDIGYIIAVLIIFGAICNWYTSTPIWILVIMAIMVYLLAFLISSIKVREEIKTINRMLQQRNEQNGRDRECEQ